MVEDRGQHRTRWGRKRRTTQVDSAELADPHPVVLFDAGEGAALQVGITGGSVTTNRAGIGNGGGVSASGARVEVSGVDFGDDGADNSPEDVARCSGEFTTSATFTFDESTGSFCL